MIITLENLTLDLRMFLLPPFEEALELSLESMEPLSEKAESLSGLSTPPLLELRAALTGKHDDVAVVDVPR